MSAIKPYLIGCLTGIALSLLLSARPAQPQRGQIHDAAQPADRADAAPRPRGIHFMGGQP